MKVRLCTHDPTHLAQTLHCFSPRETPVEGKNAIPVCFRCQRGISFNEVQWEPGVGNRRHFRIAMLVLAFLFYWYLWSWEKIFYIVKFTIK